MEAAQEFSTILHPFTAVYAAAVLALLCYAFMSYFISRRNYSHPLPPGPRGVPLLGYLPFLDTELHSYFAKLAAIHGPVFSLQLGGRLCAVISSASAAREVLRDQDATFANRDVPIAASVITYGGSEASDIVWGSYGPVWRTLRKVCSRDLLAGTAIDAYQRLRNREVRNMVARVAQRARENEAVDVGKEAFLTVMRVITSMLWGGGGGAGWMSTELVDEKFKDLIREIMTLAATPNLSDFFPWMRRLDLQGIEKKIWIVRRRFDEIFESIIAARERSRGGGKGSSEAGDFLDVMLRMEEMAGVGDGKTVLTRTHTKAVLMDMVLAGTDTTSTSVEFALAEMMKRPETIRAAQKELDKLVDHETAVEEPHAMQLPYLSAAIKETLRLHPAGPLLIPRRPSADCVVSGYTVPTGTRVLVNAWAIHRDPTVWEDPFSFKPERFLNGDAAQSDLNCNDLIYIPFGYGRRICVGKAMGERTVAHMLAALLHAFDWQLPDGENEVDLEEEFGVVLKKRRSLLLVPKLRTYSPERLYE